MREETVNRRITNAIDALPLTELRQYLKDVMRYERSKMDRDQPYFRSTFKQLTAEYAPDTPEEYADYDVDSLTEEAVSGELGQGSDFESSPTQIFEIRLKNWRQYADEQTAELGSNNGKLINVIEGQNGAGKSNLLNAVTLCFYGKEVQEQTDNEDLESLPYATRAALEGVEPSGSVAGYIEVVLGVDEPEYLFRREFKTAVKEDGSFDDSLGELELRRKSQNEWKRTDNPSTYLNQVLPARVSDYFLFDGEDLDGFFDEGYPSRVEDAILDVSHLELINRAIYHYGEIRKDFEKEASDVDGEAAVIRDELTDIEGDIQSKQEQLAEVTEDIQETQQNIKQINAKLQDVSDDYVNRRYKRREELKSEVTELEERKSEIQQDIRDILISVGPTLYGADALLDAHGHLDEMSEAENIPPRIQRRFIGELLERGECICGRPFEEHSEPATRLENLRQSVFDVSEEQLNDSSRISGLFESAQEQITRLIEKRQELSRIEDELDDSKQEIQDISNELKAHEIPDDVDVATLEDNREELDGQLTSLRERKARLDVEIEDLEEDYDEKKEELKEELDKQEEYKEIRAQLALVDLAEQSLTAIKEDILSELRTRTEANLERYFSQLIWKEEEYDVHLGHDYSIRVEDKFGDNKIGSLSAGETQVLALSFMAALTEISGFNAPVIIDTPLGRISSTPKRLIAQNLPQYMENTQITFLMTDEEYTAEVKSRLGDAVGREYRLVYEDNTTRIVPRDSVPEVNA
jgi:DNA sulfur modification protein DndD